jgi:hypothetical protein
MAFDLVQALINRGVSPAIAQKLPKNIIGNDLINLINSLQSIDAESIKVTNEILSKYGITVRGPNMAEESYLSSLYQTAKNNGSVRVEECQFVRPIQESSLLDKDNMLYNGYKFFCQLPESLSDKFMDQIPEDIEYLTDGQGQFLFKFSGVEPVFTINHLAEKVMEMAKDSKYFNRQANKTKEKLSKVKPKDPNLQLATTLNLTQGGETVDTKRKNAQKDIMSRGAKHKGRRDFSEEDNDFDTGELNEGIMGMTTVNPLLRLRELAGLSPAMDDFDDLDNKTELDGPEIPIEIPLDSNGDGDGVISLDSNPIDPKPMSSLEPGMTDKNTSSEAMNVILTNLNDIQTQIPNIRLNEYKSLILQLQDITNQLQSMGRNYLGERRKK